MIKSVGADPEVFLTDMEGNLVSAIDKIGGTKDEPRITPHGSVQEDNVAAEFNINPAHSEDEFVTNIQGAMQDLEDIVMNLGLKIATSSFEDFPRELLQHQSAMRAGCEPDFDVWSRSINSGPRLRATRKRAVGGHVHVGIEQGHPDQVGRAESLVKRMDLYIGVPSVLVEDEQRRELYGKAGAFRMPDHGVEYRTPSNFWVFKESTIRWMYQAIMQAGDAWAKASYVPPQVRECINNGDKSLAERLIKEYNLLPVPT